MSLIQTRNNGEHASEWIELITTSAYILQDSYTVIHLASSDGQVELVETLMSSGVDINIVDKVSVNY